MFNKRFKNMWKPMCSDFNTYFNSDLGSLKEQGMDQYFGILKGKDENDNTSFIYLLKEYWNNFRSKSTGKFIIHYPDGSSNSMDYYEEYTQCRLWELIDRYITELNNRLTNN